MKVKIYKAPNGKGMFKSSIPKAREGVAVDMENYIDEELQAGINPEVIILEVVEKFKKSRPEVKNIVYNKFFENDFADEDEEDEVVADTVETEDAEVGSEETEVEPDNATAYGYYDPNTYGLDLAQEGADEEGYGDEEEMARYGGQYAEGGQFAPGSIIPQGKAPYYIGMDGEPYDNAYKNGGMTKGQYVKQRIKELRKAAQGDEVKNNETNISPRGTIDSPSGFTSPEKNVASIIKQTGNEAKLKETAENEYQQYQESTMGDNFNGKFLFGGRNRKIRRANKAMFGTPIAIPGVDVNYEFGPLGGLRKATADWDLDAIGGLAQFLPGMAGMMPGMGGKYKAVSYPAQVRKKTVSTINNAALDDVAKQNPNSTAAQNNRSDKKNMVSCPPGSVYDSSLGHCVDQDGNMVRSTIDLPTPEELLGNPFENPNARMLSGKKNMKATGPSSSVSSTAASQSTQAPAAGGAPLQSQQGIMSSSMTPVLDAQGQQLTSDASNMMYGQQGLPAVSSSAPVAQSSKGVYDPETNSYIDDSSMLYDFMTNNPDIVNDPTMEQQYIQMGYTPEDWNTAKSKYLTGKEHGGFVDAANMDPNMLAKFIYGGDKYAYGGDVLPQAYDGFAGNFQKQMLATKNRINQMGSKNPADYNLFKGNAFGKATTGVQPSGTVGNRFQPTNQPNAGTTQPGGGSGIMSQQRSEELAKMTPEQRAAEAKKSEALFRQMMQDQQGNPFMGNAFGNQQFWTGRPQRLGFGLTRDFNYGSSYSPVNWQVPEGTKHLRQETYKDRGKWYNPFDTKRITDYYADPNDEGASGDLINKQGSGKNIKTASGWGSEELDTAKERRQAKAHDELIASGAQMTDNIEEPPTSMKTLSTAPNLPDQLESGAPGRMQPLPASQMSPQGEQNTELQMPENQGETELQNNPFQGNAFEGNQFGTAAGVSPSENMRFTQGPNNFSPSADNSNKLAGNAFGTSSTGVTGNANMSRPAAPSPTYPKPGVENPMADPKFVPTPQDYNPGSASSTGAGMPSQQSNPNYTEENDPLNQMPMAYGGYMAQGGYIPEYMAYGGYMPHAKNGITVDNPEFSDPNFIGRKTESAAYTFDPKQMGADLFGSKLSLTGLAASAGNAWNDAKQSDLAAQQYRSSDAAKANTGQPGFGSAEVTGTDSESGQMGAKGQYDQYGVNIGSIGYNGNNVRVKKGGPINSSYAKGKVYSLTMDQIKAIEAAGGKVEYIK